MEDPLLRWKESGFSEAYEVVRTVEIGLDQQTYRIEVLKGYSNPSIPFTTRGWMLSGVTLQPTYPLSYGQHHAKPTGMSLWVDLDLPWTAAKDPDQALAQALGWLAERAKKE